MCLKGTCMVPTTRLCTLKHPCSGPHSQAVHPHAKREGFPLTGQAPTTQHRCILKAADLPQLHTKGSPPGAPPVGPQPLMEWSSPQGCVPSTPMKVAPTRGPRALKWAQRHPHSQTHGPCVFTDHACSGRHHKDVHPQLLMQWLHPQAMHPQPHMEQAPLMCRAPSSTHRRGLMGWRPHPHTERTPPAGLAPSTIPEGFPLVGPQLDMEGSPPQYAPSTVHKGSPLVGHAPLTTRGVVVLTTRLCTLNSHEGRPTFGPHTFSWAQRGPHLQAMGPQLGTEGFPPEDWCLQPCMQWPPPAGWVPSTTHRGDSTLGTLAHNWALRGPDPWYSTPGKRKDAFLLMALASSTAQATPR